MASKIALDLKQFKHVKSDDKATMLRHADGHTLILDHSKMSPDHKAQLAALAGVAKDAATPDDKQEATEAPQKMKDGGTAGVPAALDPNAPPAPDLSTSIDTATAGAGQLTDSIAPNDSPVQIKKNMYDDKVIQSHNAGFGAGRDTTNPLENTETFRDSPNGPANLNLNVWNQVNDQYQAKAADQNAVAKATVDSITAQNKARVEANLPPIPLPPGVQAITDPAPGSDPAALVGVPQSAGSTGSGSQVPDAMGLFQKGYANQMAGADAQAKALGNMGDEQAGYLQQDVAARDTAMKAYQGKYDALEQERQNAIQDVKDGHIDPNQYWTGDANGNGGHSKIMAGIGMILGGFTPNGQANGAVQFIQHQMGLNMQAQMKNLDSKQNLLAANLHQFGNLKDATTMTQIMQNDMVMHQLDLAAAKAKSPMAKAAALSAKGQIQTQLVPMAQQFAMRQAMMSLGNDPSGNSDQAAVKMMQMARLSNPELAKDMESRYVPGYGMSQTTPVPADVRAKLVAHEDVQRSLQQVQQFSKEHAGSVDPRVRATGSTLMNELASKIRTAEGQGVYKESEAKMMMQTMGDNPASFTAALTTQPRLRTLMQLKQSEADTLAKGYGLRPKDPAANLDPKTRAYVDAARRDPSNPKSQMILNKLGLTR